MNTLPHFPESNQRAESDSFRRDTASLLLVIIILFGMGFWLFRGKLTFAESSTDIVLLPNNVIQVQLTTEQADGVQLEMPVDVHYVNEHGEAIIAPTTVIDIIKSSATTRQLDLLVTDRQTIIDLYTGSDPITQVVIVKQTMSPARFIFTAAGLAK